jgi:hypothetical protein
MPEKDPSDINGLAEGHRRRVFSKGGLKAAVSGFERTNGLVADRASRSAIAVVVSTDVLAADPTSRIPISISVGVDDAAAVDSRSYIQSDPSEEESFGRAVEEPKLSPLAMQERGAS